MTAPDKQPFLASLAHAIVRLVPALMRLLGRWNWWLPRVAARALFVHRREPALESA
jgi:uncharacterized membrane protein YdfJ with MMPL/SSD domain